MKIKNYFLAGLLAVLPISATIYLTKTIFSYLTKYLTNIFPSFYSFHEDKSYIYNIVLSTVSSIAYILVVVAIISVIGMVTLNYFGKVIIRGVELLISKVPLSRTIYSTVKQITELFVSTESTPYKQVVIVDYLRKGSYGLGFLTNESLKVYSQDKEEEFATVFIPTAPNPTTGFLVIVKREDIIPIDMKIEDAIRLVISGGALKPSTYIKR